MTIAVALGVQGSHNFNNQPSFVTGSWTPTASRLLIASFNTTRLGTIPTPTISGNGLTWSLLTDQQFDTGPLGTDKHYRLTTWVALSGASPSTGAITISVSSNCNGYNFVCDEINGADISGTALAAIVQTILGPVDAAAGDLSMTLASAITGSNASYGAMCHEISGGTSTAGSGYTKSGEQANSTPGRLHTQYQVPGITTVNCTWSGSGQFGGVGMEIKEAAVAPLETIDTDIIKVAAALSAQQSSSQIVTTIENILAAIAAKQEYDLHLATTIKKVAANIQLSQPSVESDVWVPTWVNDNEVWIETWE